MYQNVVSFKEAGFSGFVSINQLWNDPNSIPNEKGVYVILNPDSSKKQFLQTGVGGHFKGKDPNVTIDQLHSNWVDNSPLLYVGQAGGNHSSATLRKRLKQF